ncbi:MAG TPA: carboxypeptidase regulatory-like domain-containing protein [Thermoanaerobaculia bacterium]|nr:carboxypeptidase regulatory-like domain-containing protein [Thermoanaerobaculia bacterium]
MLENRTSFRRLFTLAIALCALVVVPAANAQVTTGSIAGQVSASGEALPGVTVEAIHVPTGTRYDAVSGGNGRYTIPNVRVGGPYRITATLEGFRPFEATNINVALGSTAEVGVSMQLSTVSESITVTATADDIINPNRTGAASAVSEEQIESLPTVNRSLQDFARTNPYFNVDAGDATATRMTVAGKSNRYNNIQIDGAVNNDLFGLADTGTPGGQADAPPISLDAIQEIQLVVSPYDVRHGGFTGGGVNAITRSGSNEFTGSVFYSKRDASFVGDGPGDTPITDFDAEQYGARLGGPILRDKLFFFVNGEINERSEPTGVSALPGTDTLRADIAALATRAKDVAMSRYNHDVGTLGEFPQTKQSDNYFARLDWNIGNSNQLTLRHNYVDAARDVVADRFFTRFRFPTSTYVFADETKSTVAQLNSAIGSNLFNEARVNFTNIADTRASRTQFPAVEIGGAVRNAQVILGSEQFSQANSLDQDILEITDDLTWVSGNHTMTFGTHNELFEFANLFLAPAYGFYFFPTVEAFEAGTPSHYEVTFATGDDPRRPTTFDVAQYSLYANDQWHVNQNLTLTFGIRADMPRFGTTPSFNQVVADAIGFDSSTTPSEEILFSPRFGFNWQIAGTQQLRGGLGIFAGRAPYVWISNAYANTGVEQQTLVCTGSCTTTFQPDPFSQPRSFPAGTGAIRVNMVDEDFQLPHVLRGTLGYDRDLFWGIRGTAEVVYTKNMQDVYYTDLNSRQSGTSTLDGRPTYSRISTRLTQAVLIKNTDEGDQTLASLQLNKRFTGGLTLATSYTHQDSNSAFDGSSSQAHSNFQFHHTRGDIFTPEVSRSAYETTHRFNLAASYNLQTGILGHTFGLYYNVQSGRPFSLLFGTDINTDGFSTNDLLYLPAADDVIIQRNAGSTWTGDPYQQYLSFLENAGVEDPTGDRTMTRYELTEPWVRQLDFHYELGLPIVRRFNSAITLDVNNLLNMFDKDAGVVRFVANQNYLPFTYGGLDAATGKPIYRERFADDIEDNGHLSTADLRSRWQAAVRLRLSF